MKCYLIPHLIETDYSYSPSLSSASISLTPKISRMQLIIDKLSAIKNSPERSDYHPELLLGRHIALVALKALLLYDNRNLVVAAILHDICKPDSGITKFDTFGNKYWSNPDHPVQAYNFCKEWNVHNWILDMRATPSIVEAIVLNHMRAKAYLDGRSPKLQVREIPFIYEFVICDDMVNRVKYSIDRRITLPDIGEIRGNITFIGQSFIDVRRGYTFTITVNRTPFTYYFNQIPEFFDDSLKPFIKALI